MFGELRAPKNAKTQAALRTHVRCPLVLPNFNQNWNVFSKIPLQHIS